MKNDFLTFIFHFVKKCKMICLRNVVIFIFQNHQKMNDPKTHALEWCLFYLIIILSNYPNCLIFSTYRSIVTLSAQTNVPFLYPNNITIELTFAGINMFLAHSLCFSKKQLHLNGFRLFIHCLSRQRAKMYFSPLICLF